MRACRIVLVVAGLLAGTAAGACSAESASPTADACCELGAGPVRDAADVAGNAPDAPSGDAPDVLSADAPDAPPADVGPPAVVPDGDLDWTVRREVVYARGLSHHDEFGDEDSEPIELAGDLYLPDSSDDGPDARRPALTIVHGGGLFGGSRSQTELVEFAEYFAARGWVVFSIDYRLVDDYGTLPDAWAEAVDARESSWAEKLRDKAMYPAARDARAAVRWLQAHADDHGVSPEHVAVLGASAGAHLAVALGATDPADFRDEISAERDPTLPTTHRDESGRVAAVVDLWGGPDAVTTLADAYDQPPRWDSSDAPLLIVHGTDDAIAPISRADALRDAYRTTGAPYTYVPIDDAGHGPWQATPDGRHLRRLAHDFLLEHMPLRSAD